jgi:hypothetical protein
MAMAVSRSPAKSHVADDSAVQAAPRRLELLDDLHRPGLRRPGQRPAGKVAVSTSYAVRPSASVPTTEDTMCMMCE